MEEEDEEEEPMEEINGKFAAILDAADTKYPAEHTHRNHTRLFTALGTDLIQVEYPLSKKGNWESSTAASPDWG